MRTFQKKRRVFLCTTFDNYEYLTIAFDNRGLDDFKIKKKSIICDRQRGVREVNRHFMSIRLCISKCFQFRLKRNEGKT